MYRANVPLRNKPNVYSKCPGARSMRPHLTRVESRSFQWQELGELFAPQPAELRRQTCTAIAKYFPREPRHLMRNSEGLEPANRDVVGIDLRSAPRAQHEIL